MIDQVCRDCGYRGQPKTEARGSVQVEAALWLLAIAGAVFGFWWGLVLPIGYGLYRVSTKYKACPKCSGDRMIPVDTPLGHELAQKSSPPSAPPAVAESDRPTKKPYWMS